MLLPAVETHWRVQQTTLANRILEKGQGSVHQFPKWTHFCFNWSFQGSPGPVCALAHTPTHSCMYMSPYRQPQHGAPIFASLSPIKRWDSIVLAQSMWHLPPSPQTPLPMQARARALAALLIHSDIWVGRKASLITLADFQVLFCLNNVFRNPVCILALLSLNLDLEFCSPERHLLPQPGQCMLGIKITQSFICVLLGFDNLYTSLSQRRFDL